MIYIGYSDNEKHKIVSDYAEAHGITKTFVIQPERFAIEFNGADHVTYETAINYVVYYRLLQEIDTTTLVVVNECLRTQNRYDLTYNCIRNYLNQTDHQIIFQQLPQIDTREDFMILFDFDTKSRWKRRHYDAEFVLDNCELSVKSLPLAFHRIDVPTTGKTQQRYEAEKEKLFREIGARDPHTLPRNLYLIGGSDKVSATNPFRWYVARNRRLKIKNIDVYGDAKRNDYGIIEFPHRFIDFSDFVKRTGQHDFDVLVTALKVCQWYYNRYTEWSNRLHETYSDLST